MVFKDYLGIVATSLGMISVVISIVFAFKSNKRTDTCEIEARVKENTVLNMKLDGILQTTTTIVNKVESMNRDLQNHNDRLIRVEESTKSAHHRIDTIEGKIDADA